MTWPKDAIVNGDCILDPAIRSKGECVRVDTWVQTGSVVTSHFDPMVAKIIVYSSESRAKVAQDTDSLYVAIPVSGGPHGHWPNFTGLILGRIEANFCKKICV